MNTNSLVIFFHASDGSVTVTASQQKAMTCKMPRQPTTLSLRNSALSRPCKMNFVAYSWREALPCHVPTIWFREWKFCWGLWKACYLFWYQENKTPHQGLFKGLRREQGWDALRGKNGAVTILAEDLIVEKNLGKPWSRAISTCSLKLSNLFSLLNHYYKSPRLYCWLINILLAFFLCAIFIKALRIQ